MTKMVGDRHANLKMNLRRQRNTEETVGSNTTRELVELLATERDVLDSHPDCPRPHTNLRRGRSRAGQQTADRFSFDIFGPQAPAIRFPMLQNRFGTERVVRAIKARAGYDPYAQREPKGPNPCGRRSVATGVSQ